MPHASRIVRQAEPTLAVLWCACTAVLLCWTFVAGLSFLTFPDEAAQVLGGQILDDGGVLYRTFVDSHGPFIFMLAQVYGGMFGWSAPNGVRGFNILLTVLAVLSVAASPALTSPRARIWAMSLFCTLLAGIWLRQGFYQFSFYPLAGALASIVLSGLVLPACQGGSPSPGRALPAGLALVCLVANAYSFAPSAVLLALAGSSTAAVAGRRGARMALGTGILLGLIGFGAYMRIFADLRGYLAFHVAENQFVYSHYIGASLGQFWLSLVPSPDRLERVQDIALCCMAAGLAGQLALAARHAEDRARRSWVIAATFAGIVLLNGRGSITFQDGTFVYAAITAFSITSANVLALLARRARIAGTLGTVLVAGAALLATRQAPYLPQGMTAWEIAKTPKWPIGSPSDAPLFRLIRRITRPEQRILALPYHPRFYLLAGRMPIDGYYAYFRWDADYAQEPWFGRPHDLCTALGKTLPAVISVAEVGVWGYRPRSYVPCLADILRTRYTQDKAMSGNDGDLYILDGFVLGDHQPDNPAFGPIRTSDGASPPMRR